MSCSRVENGAFYQVGPKCVLNTRRTSKIPQFKIKGSGYILVDGILRVSVNANTCGPCDLDTALATLQTKTEEFMQSSSEHYTKKEDTLAQHYC